MSAADRRPVTTPNTPSTPTSSATPSALPAGRRLLLVAVAVLPLLVVVVATAVAAGHVPDRLAVHWSAAGRADGFGSLGHVRVVGVVWTVLAALVGAAAALVSGGRPRTRRWLAVGAAAAGWGAAGVVVGLLGASWGRTGPGAPAAFPLLLVPAALLGVVAVLLLWPRPHTVVAPDLDAPGLPLRPGERAVWVRHLTSRPFAVATAVGLVGAAATALLVPRDDPLALGLGVPLLVLGASCAWLSSIAVVVDATGLTVRLGPLGHPAKHVPLRDVAAARAADVDPLAWGGWGYRARPDRSAVVLRGGEGIVLDLADGRRFAVTVDDAATGAALLTTLLRARPAPSPSPSPSPSPDEAQRTRP